MGSRIEIIIPNSLISVEFVDSWIWIRVSLFFLHSLEKNLVDRNCWIMRTFSRHEICEIVLAYLNYKTENLKAENYGENRPKVQEYISLPISRFFKDLVFIKKYNSYSNNHFFFQIVSICILWFNCTSLFSAKVEINQIPAMIHQIVLMWVICRFESH